MTIQELLIKLGLNEEKIRDRIILEQHILQKHPDEARQTAEHALTQYPIHIDSPEIYPGQNQMIQVATSGFLSGLACAYDMMATDFEIILTNCKEKTITIGE